MKQHQKLHKTLEEICFLLEERKKRIAFDKKHKNLADLIYSVPSETDDGGYGDFIEEHIQDYVYAAETETEDIEEINEMLLFFNKLKNGAQSFKGISQLISRQ